MLLHFRNSSCAYNQWWNLQQKPVLLKQSIFTSLFYPYLFTKSSLQSPLTFPSSIPQQFFTSFFLRTTTPTSYTKNIFPTSTILPIQTKEPVTRKLGSLLRNDTALFSPFFKAWTVKTGLTITDSLSLTLNIGVFQVWLTILSTFSHTLQLLPLLPPYLNNTTSRTRIPLESSCLTWYSS